MRIDYLQLENIKSYRATTRIELTEGVNAICGQNGSGKTTVLEAIGFALFGSLAYPQVAFVREGEKYGTIRVGLRDRDDRRYEVVRRIGSGAHHLVIDVETDTRIADSKEVFAWIRGHALQLEGDVDLTALFENAVGVPQGTLTSDFLLAAGKRKSIFDPLLRVEEYRHAYEQLRDTITFLRERTALEDQAIAGLRTDTDRIPELVDRAGALDEQVAGSRSLLLRLVTEAEQLKAERGELEELERRLLLLQDETRGAEYNLQRARDLQLQSAEAVAAAEQAAEEVRATEPGYRQVLAARERLHALERARLERDDLTAQLATANTEARGIFGQIEQLDRNLEQALDAAAQAANLNEDANRQLAMEGELRELQMEVRDLKRLESELTRFQGEIDQLHKEQTALDRRVASAIEAEALAGELQPAEEALDVVKRELNGLPTLRDEQERIRGEGARLKTERTRLADELRRRRAAEEQLVALEPLATSVAGLQARATEIREQRAVRRAALTYQEYARGQLAAGNCPLVGQACPVVAANPAVLVRLDAGDELLESDLQQAESELLQLEGELERAHTAAGELQRLLALIAAFDPDEDALDNIEAELRARNQRYQEISAMLEHEKLWKGQLEAAHLRVRRSQLAARQAAERPVLEEQRQRNAQLLERLQQQLNSTRERHLALSATGQRATALEQEILALGDPHGRQREFLTLAARRSSIEEQVTEQQLRLTEARGRVKALSGLLAVFSRLDTEFETERERERSAMAEYERYLQHLAVADQLTSRQGVLATHTEALRRAEATVSDVSTRRDALASTYDVKQHREVKQAAEAADREAVKQTAAHRYLESDLKRVDDDLANLRRKESVLQRHLTERGRLADTERAIKFIRETVNAAGPAVTEALLHTISQGASDIYSEIIDDHAVELRWDRDYEILVQHGPETRKFAQLSGGEQMGAALAVRLALLKEMSDVDFAFFDEPTQNMDNERRGNLAEQIRQIRGFDQLIVISHDDTFEHHTDNVIRLRKVHGETELDTDAITG